jgi:hypothetical protein
MRAQQEIRAQIERIEAFARGMIGRDVECVEVIFVGLDFRSEDDCKTMAREESRDVGHHAADRMQRAATRGRTGERHIDRIAQ